MPDAVPTAEDLARVGALVAREADPAHAFRAVDALAARVWDHNLLTVLRYLEDTVEVERLYSSNPVAYPVGGRKQKKGTPWGERVLDRGEPFICHTAADIRWAFADHELIFSLGIAGMVNIPILFRGRCVGTMNVSAATDRFTEADYPVGRTLAGLLLPLVLGDARAA